MRSHNYASLPDVTSLLSKSCLCSDFKDSANEEMEENCEKFNDSFCKLDGLEEVFADHLLMDKRLRKTLYAGGFNGLEDRRDHPPLALTGLALELFSKAVPNYGLDILDMDYVSAASEAAKISPCTMIIAMIYLERLQLSNSEYLETVSPPGLFVVTMLVASKFLFEDEEDVVTNQMWAEALNFDVKELNNLEHDFLSAIDWKVFVDSTDYFRYLHGVEKVIAIKQSSLRDWLSYSDIYILLEDPGFQTFWKAVFKKIIKTTALWTLGYLATALALYCSGIGFQKLKPAKVVSHKLVKNDTMELQNSAPTTIHFYVTEHMYSHMQLTDNEFTHSSLVLDIHNENHDSYNAENDCCFSCCSVAGKRKTHIYNLEITREPAFQKPRSLYSGYLFETPPVLNTTITDNSSSLKLTKTKCGKQQQDLKLGYFF